MDKTLIFATENHCPEPLFSAVIRDLKAKAEGIPIVSVSHKPIDLGTNICIGEHRRSWTMLYRQLLKGLYIAKTKYIGIVEHDCFYTREHLEYIPPSDDKFYYNENMWLVSWDERKPDKKGNYTRFWTERLALSQMVCNREIYINALEGRLDLIDEDRQAFKKIDHVNEPGVSKVSEKREKLMQRANSGSSAYIRYLLPDFIELEQYETFNNEIPNLDVRHGGNFTGPRRGNRPVTEVPYWGKFKDLLRG